METRDVAEKIKEVVSRIVERDVKSLHEADLEKSYEPDDVLNAIMEYPDKLQNSPDGYNYLNFRFYFESDSQILVEFEIWANDTPSDLTLILRLNEIDGELFYSLIDLRVL